jgi:hypothetical protein
MLNPDDVSHSPEVEDRKESICFAIFVYKKRRPNMFRRKKVKPHIKIECGSAISIKFINH